MPELRPLLYAAAQHPGHVGQLMKTRKCLVRGMLELLELLELTETTCYEFVDRVRTADLYRRDSDVWHTVVVCE